MSRACRLIIVLAFLAACDRPGDAERERVLAGRALRGVVAYPRSTMVNLAAGDEAAELVMSSPDSVAMVARWFRTALPLNGWKVEREVPGQTGDVTLYALKGNRPLWITMRPNVGAPGTTYTMIGAIVGDSAKSP